MHAKRPLLVPQSCLIDAVSMHVHMYMHVHMSMHMHTKRPLLVPQSCLIRAVSTSEETATMRHEARTHLGTCVKKGVRKRSVRMTDTAVMMPAS